MKNPGFKVALVLLIMWAIIYGSYSLYMHVESEKEWKVINSEYRIISGEVEICNYACQFEEDLRHCFDVCDDQLNSSLEEIGIRHKAWRKKYVD